MIKIHSGWAVRWNRCDVCGRFISLADFDIGKATRSISAPDSEFTNEDYETLCKNHQPNKT